MSKRNFIFVLALLLSTFCYGEDDNILVSKTIEGVDVTYRVRDEREVEVYAYKDETTTVRMVNGEMEGSFVPAIDSLTRGKITIPEVVDGHTVVKIDEGAFYGCKNISEIVIPQSVREIEDYAFWRSGIITMSLPTSWVGNRWFIECQNLKSVTLAPLDEYTPFHRIGDRAFMGCTSLTDYGAGNLPVEASDRSFWGCESLVTVRLAAEVPDELCYGCLNLKNVELPNTFASRIGYGAFYGCKNLMNINLPLKIDDGWGNGGQIGDRAFYGCESLTTLSIPEGTNSLGSEAFAYCSGARSLSIPSTLDNIEVGQFVGCVSLETIVVANGNEHYDSRENCNAIIYKGDGQPVLLRGCNGTSIPASVREIGRMAFECNALERMMIPEGVEYISDGAFCGCRSLAYVSIPSTVAYASSDIFGRDEIVSEWNWETGEQHYDTIRYSCPMLSELYIGSPEVGRISLETLKKVTLGPNVKSIMSSAFEDCTSLESIFIPKSVEDLGGGYGSPIVNCPSLKSLVVEEGNPRYDSRNDCNAVIETSTNELISGCSTTVIPETVTSIGSGAFWGSGILSVSFSPNLTTIGSGAFAKSLLSSITIPKTVKTIGSGAFQGCPLQSIVIESDETDIPLDAFSCAEELYLDAPIIKGWFSGDDIQKLTIGKSAKIIGTEAFRTCENLQSVEMPEGLQTISAGAFWSCDKLQEVTIPSTVKTIGIDAFRSCESLQSVTSRIAQPFNISEWVFYAKGDKIYSQATLYVPVNTKNLYQNTTAWNKFLKIVETEMATGIGDVVSVNATEAAVYSADGRQRAKAGHGLNIIRMRDGSVRKVMR